jgi:hypothetical protein
MVLGWRADDTTSDQFDCKDFSQRTLGVTTQLSSWSAPACGGPGAVADGGDDSAVVGCEGCGSRAVGHGRRPLKVRDLPMADRPVVLEWAKRLWRCPDPDCAVGTWSEDVDDIAPRAALTDRHGGEHPPGSRCVAGDDEPADHRLARHVSITRWSPRGIATRCRRLSGRRGCERSAAADRVATMGQQLGSADSWFHQVCESTLAFVAWPAVFASRSQRGDLRHHHC